MRCVDQPVHRGVDARGGATFAVQAVVERGHHVVLPVQAGVHGGQGAEPVQPEHGQALFLQGAQVATGTLHPQQFHRLPGDRVGGGALGGGVPARVVGVPRVGAQSVRPGDQVLGGGVSHRKSSPASSEGRGSATVGRSGSRDFSGAPTGLRAADPLGRDLGGVAG